MRHTHCNALEYLEYFSLKKGKPTQLKWQPPTEEMLKINIDGSFQPGNSFGGWGLVVRESVGHVITAHAGRHENVSDAFGTEVTAMSATITVASELGALRVIFETHCQLMAEALDLPTLRSLRTSNSSLRCGSRTKESAIADVRPTR